MAKNKLWVLLLSTWKYNERIVQLQKMGFKVSSVSAIKATRKYLAIFPMKMNKIFCRTRTQINVRKYLQKLQRTCHTQLAMFLSLDFCKMKKKNYLYAKKIQKYVIIHNILTKCVLLFFLSFFLSFFIYTHTHIQRFTATNWLWHNSTFNYRIDWLPPRESSMPY